MQRGVFYTPRPVVSYIVRYVDELLRSEFGLADGLADTTTWGEMAKCHKDLKIPEGVSPDQDFVQILDPATGTGTFLVEAIDLIHKTLVAKWKAEGHGEEEIDALWKTPALRRIVDPYRAVDGHPIRERSMLQFEKNIQDDYVKFFAFSQARLSQSGSGICSPISNHSYLDGPTLRGMRWNLITCFPRSWFLDLHGNANKAEVPPDGVKEENVFDIRQGVSICVLVKSLNNRLGATIGVNEFWGASGRKYQLLAEASVTTTPWARIDATPPYYYLTKPDSGEIGSEWEGWPAICDLFTKRSTGTETGFDDLLVAFTKSQLIQHVGQFADPSATRESVSKRFDVSKGHASALFSRRRELNRLQGGDVGQLQLRAFDYRWALLRKNLLKTNSFNVMLDLNDRSPGLVTTRQTKEQFSAFAVKGFCGHKVTSSYDRSYVLPLFARGSGGLISEEDICLDRSWLATFREMHVAAEAKVPGDSLLALSIFNYTLAILNASSFVTCFGERLKRDWPRLPIPGSLALFLGLAELGKILASVQMMESPKLGQPITEFIGGRNPEVDKVSWSKDTVWLNKAQTAGFRGVREDVWNFHIGGYQVCAEWLKDRKGRRLSDDDFIRRRSSTGARGSFGFASWSTPNPTPGRLMTGRFS